MAHLLKLQFRHFTQQLPNLRFNTIIKAILYNKIIRRYNNVKYCRYKKELGENIYLYPLTPSSIRGCSLDLRASEFGWSLKTNSRLKIDQGCLILNSNDTALIYTKESIYVSNRIGGTYHSKVGLVSSAL